MKNWKLKGNETNHHSNRSRAVGLIRAVCYRLTHIRTMKAHDPTAIRLAANALLYDAAYGGNIDDAKQAIADGADVNVKNK